ncbi:phosphate-starvation-inducible PsiE family protein [Jiella sp. MQZ9-1]|uniref:Phosphate-starvation-inducible PsiE family protein n=1 Tax=Jiella flava TaxID=2816857 RepID=A0A939JWP7_9HYPH|nr:phosphate-starvation-inducible PsiE family protein [Jiella flava]MBO0663739.1 phosphate-starvation-inducible PsiE family protein [Jiella flava]MCD2472311.1 phosphate-starvation-inducible PsiE family protein [Jiella flava]
MHLVKLYFRFERVIANLLLVGMVGVVLLALWSFLRATGLALADLGHPLEYNSFQVLFDRVLAVVIALELAHSIHQMAIGDHRLAQVKTVVVIGVLAVVRKLILLEVDSTSGMFLAGLAATMIALGLLLVMVHWVDRRESAGEGRGRTGQNASLHEPD